MGGSFLKLFFPAEMYSLYMKGDPMLGPFPLLFSQSFYLVFFSLVSGDAGQRFPIYQSPVSSLYLFLFFEFLYCFGWAVRLL